MWQAREASLPRFRSKTHYEWFPMSVLWFNSLSILRLTKYWIEVRRRLRSSLAPTFLACGNRIHSYIPCWTQCGWMEVVTLLSWQYPFSEDAFDMHKLINRVEPDPWIWSPAIWTPWTASSAMQTKPILNLLITCQQNWSTSAIIVASRMNYRERGTSGKMLQFRWILSAL